MFVSFTTKSVGLLDHAVSWLYAFAGLFVESRNQPTDNLFVKDLET